LIRDDDGDVVLTREGQGLVSALREQERKNLPEIESEGVEVVALVVDHEHRILGQVE
jgi:hypothetical protein